MIVSSLGFDGRWDRGEGAVVAQQCPQDVDEAAGQGDGGLGVALPFGSFTVVEGAGRAGGLQAGEGGHVEDMPQSAVVAAWPVPHAGAASGVMGYWGQAGVGGQARWSTEGCQVAGGDGEE